MKETGMGHFEIMEMPFKFFLAYIKQAQIYQLQQTEEGRDALERGRMMTETKADIGKVRKLINKK